MTHSEIEFLKAHIDRVVEIETKQGERLTVKVLALFDEEPDADIFFDLVSLDASASTPTSGGFSVRLDDIVSVRAVGE